ncbi:MAG: hypothetical protein ACOYJ1_05850 [Peptococcales bacterium]
MGDDITFLVCRALIKLPPDRREVEKVVETNGKNVINYISMIDNPRGVMGKLLVDLNLQMVGRGERTELIKLAIPYQASVRSFGTINPEVKYIHAEIVGVNSLLVEGIISLTSLGYIPRRGMVRGMTSEFTSESTIRIANVLPEVKEMVSAQVRFIPLGHSLEEKSLTLNGWKETYLMYIADKTKGEKVIVTRQVEPFTETMFLDEKMSALSYLDIINRSIQSQVIGSREVLVKGNFELKVQPSASPSQEMLSPQVMLQEIKKLSQKIKAKKKTQNVRIDIEEREAEQDTSETIENEVRQEANEISQPLEIAAEVEEEIFSEVTLEEETISDSLDESPLVAEEIESATFSNEIVEDMISGISEEEQVDEVISDIPDKDQADEVITNFSEVVEKQEYFPPEEVSIIEPELQSDNIILFNRESKRSKLKKHMRELKSL